MSKHSKRTRPLVLIVEDDPVMRRVGQLNLDRYNVDIHSANNGLQAIIACALYHYDLILMDLHLPFVSGIEATKRIRAIERSRKQRTVIVAVTADDEITKKVPGFDGQVTKPADYERLIEYWLYEAHTEPLASRNS